MALIRTKQILTIPASKAKLGVQSAGKVIAKVANANEKNPNEVYYIWICQTKSDKGTKYCTARSISEKNAEIRVCRDVWNGNF